jgi:hypothetical protein
MPEKANLSPNDDLLFKALIEGYVTSPRFIRRDWLAQEVEKKLHEPGCRFVLLTAEPGAGKSAFMAQLAHDHPKWSLSHPRVNRHWLRVQSEVDRDGNCEAAPGGLVQPA